MTTFSVFNLQIIVEQQKLIEDLSFSFKPATIVGLLGPNGSGKTMLLHTLGGLRRPNRGRIEFNTQTLDHLLPQDRAKHIGLLLQQPIAGFPSTVLETALTGLYPHSSSWSRLGTNQNLDKVHPILETVSLSSLAHREVQTLSGGETQRLMIATLLVQDPEVFLLDEPLNHLDFKQQPHVLRLFKDLAKQQGKIVIMALHDIAAINTYCDIVLTFDGNGKISAFATPFPEQR